MELNELLLRTAFACMACDGDIASEEVELIRQIFKDNNLFEKDDVNEKLDELVKEINQEGKAFLKKYLQALAEQSLTEEEEIKVVE